MKILSEGGGSNYYDTPPKGGFNKKVNGQQNDAINPALEVLGKGVLEALSVEATNGWGNVTVKVEIDGVVIFENIQVAGLVGVIGSSGSAFGGTLTTTSYGGSPQMHFKQSLRIWLLSGSSDDNLHIFGRLI